MELSEEHAAKQFRARVDSMGDILMSHQVWHCTYSLPADDAGADGLAFGYGGLGACIDEAMERYS
eukprot:1475861-Amphidinium_carterae.1